MRELRLEELSVRQKLGLVTVALTSSDESEFEFILKQIKEHSSTT